MSAMSPKFISLHFFRSDQILESDHDIIMLNPRRVDYFQPMPSPNNPNQRTLYCGTRVQLGSNKFVVVNETINEIKRMLK